MGLPSKNNRSRRLLTYLPLLLIVGVAVVRCCFFFLYRVTPGECSPLPTGTVLLLHKQASPQVGQYVLVGDRSFWNWRHKGILLQVVAQPGDTVIVSRNQGGVAEQRVLSPEQYQVVMECHNERKYAFVNRSEIIAVTCR